MVRIPRSAVATMTIVAVTLLPFLGTAPVTARGVTPACGEGAAVERASSAVRAAALPASTVDGPWDRYALPGGPDATDRHLVVTGAQTATLIWRERHQLYVARSTDGGHTFAWVTELVDPSRARVTCP